MIHIIPQNDEREHEISASCWCCPVVLWNDPQTGELWVKGTAVVTHNSADCRETVEQVTGEKWEHGWMVLDDSVEVKIEEEEQ